MWGPGAPDPVEGFTVVDGVYMVDGNHPYLWRHRFSAPLIAAGRRVEITAALRNFAQNRANHTAAHAQPFRRTTRRRHGMSDAA